MCAKISIAWGGGQLFVRPYLQQAVHLIDVWLSILHGDMAQVEEGELRDHVVHLRERERERKRIHAQTIALTGDGCLTSFCRKCGVFLE